MISSFPVIRSILFVPGSRPDFLPKAAAAGADALILDLEDSVPPQGKEAARVHVAQALRQMPAQLAFVRVNHPCAGMLEKDLSVLAPQDRQVVVLPKVEEAGDVLRTDRLLAELERANGLQAHAIGIVVTVESSLGLRNLYEALRASPRVRGAALASAEEGDFMVDIGGRWTPEGAALGYARGKFVCDARAAGAAWLIDGAFMNLQSTEALEAEARLARTYGFNGKMAIHPRQVALINDAFSPSAAELERARQLLQAFRAAEAQGKGAVQFQGMMVDYANVRRAQQILALAQASR